MVLCNGTHWQSAPDLLTCWVISVNFNLPLSLSLSLFTLCACSSHHPVVFVCSFDTIYHPTDFTVMNETQNFTMYHFRFYAVFVIWTRKEKKKPRKTKQKHYRFKSRGFFSPAVFFYAVAKGCIFQLLLEL